VKHFISSYIHLLDQNSLYNQIHTLFHLNLAISSIFLIEMKNFMAKNRQLFWNGAIRHHGAKKKGCRTWRSNSATKCKIEFQRQILRGPRPFAHFKLVTLKMTRVTSFQKWLNFYQIWPFGRILTTIKCQS